MGPLQRIHGNEEEYCTECGAPTIYERDDLPICRDCHVRTKRQAGEFEGFSYIVAWIFKAIVTLAVIAFICFLIWAYWNNR